MKLTASPKCPKYFKLDKAKCRCTIKKNHLDKFIKNKTKKAKKAKKAKTPKQRLPRINVNPKLPKNRCPTGMYFNRKLQMCELDVMNTKKLKKTKKKEKKKAKKKKIRIEKSHTTGSGFSFNVENSSSDHPKTKKNKKTVVVKNKTPMINKILGKFYQREAEVVPKNKALTVKKALANLDKVASFSPEVNRELVSMKTIARNTVDDCDTFMGNTPKIRIRNGKCLPFNNIEVQDYLLTNLSSKSNIDCNKIVAPRQVASNCWFNTMFMTCFVSDKGRKFFRFFRQLMIKGVTSKGVPIAKDLHIALFKLNMAIEAVLGSGSNNSNPVSRKMALNMNTNVIIQKVYDSIPPAFRRDIYGKNKAGNPLFYYQAIISYLGDNSVNILNVHTNLSNENYWGHNWEQAIYTTMGYHGKEALPDVIVLEFMDEPDDVNPSFAPSKKSNKPLEFTVKSKTGDAKYTLDSCVIRDIEKHHFASTLTCNKKPFGFDGISFGRLNAFSWKKLINVNKNWTFEGSDTEWNFRNGYQLLYYYRN
jgi:hypothetical protein